MRPGFLLPRGRISRNLGARDYIIAQLCTIYSQVLGILTPSPTLRGRHIKKPLRLRGLTKEDDGTLPVCLLGSCTWLGREGGREGGRRLPLLVTSRHYKEYLSLPSSLPSSEGRSQPAHKNYQRGLNQRHLRFGQSNDI